MIELTVQLPPSEDLCHIGSQNTPQRFLRGYLLYLPPCTRMIGFPVRVIVISCSPLCGTIGTRRDLVAVFRPVAVDVVQHFCMVAARLPGRGALVEGVWVKLSVGSGSKFPA